MSVVALMLLKKSRQFVSPPPARKSTSQNALQAVRGPRLSRTVLGEQAFERSDLQHSPVSMLCQQPRSLSCGRGCDESAESQGSQHIPYLAAECQQSAEEAQARAHIDDYRRFVQQHNICAG